MVLPGLHTPNEIQVDKAVNTRYSPTDATALIVGDIEELSQQANVPRQLRQPAQSTQHHRRKALKAEWLIQLDYAYIKSNVHQTK
eukprot:220-Amphidinium_carterae.1